MTKAPNILVFVTDDHARWALPTYGGTGLTTPTIDALAARGTVFDNAYTNCPVCSPARASVLTGLVPAQHGVRDFIAAAPRYHAPDRLAGLDTLPEQLQRAGYRCGLSGKWHIGRDEHPARGFDFWHALSGVYPITHDGHQEMSRNGELFEHHGSLTDTITQGALEFLAGQGADQPFFLYVSYYATHSPWTGQPADRVQAARAEPTSVMTPDAVPPGYRAENPERPPPGHEAEALAQYRAAIADIDHGIGRILAALDDVDTLVVYTADHGLALGQGGIWGKGNATRPQNLFDHSVRIPMILSRPGMLAQGAHNPRFMDHCDLYRIVRDAAGLSGPERDGLARPGLSLGQPKPFQVCEYGTVARIITPDATGERRPDQDTTGALSSALTQYYQDLGCVPPWAWQPPSEPLYNMCEAWR